MSFNKRDYLSRGDNRALLSRRNRRRVGTRFAIGLLAVAIMTLVAQDVTAPVSYTHLTLPTTPYV